MDESTLEESFDSPLKKIQKKKRIPYIYRKYGRQTIINKYIQKNAITKFSSSSFKKGQEIKTLDSRFVGAYSAGTYTPDTVPFQQLPMNSQTNIVQALNLVQQGAGISQRIGNKISMKSLRLRFAFSRTGVDALTSFSTRIMVLYDRNPNGTYIASNTILAQSRSDNTIQNGNYLENLNPNFFDRFVILSDDFISTPTVAAAGINSTLEQGPTGSSAFIYDKYIKLKNLETTYNGTASPLLIANVNIGALLILVYGEATANTNDGWNMQGSARLRFRDN